MRNQRRKLYPNLFNAFKKFTSLSNKNVYLYCHTSYPDVGWDMPALIKEYGLSSKVLVTYVCKKCKFFFPNFFSGPVIGCPRCKSIACSMSNVTNGVDTDGLAKIMQTFDLYVQYANSEGLGIPLVEASACGIPVMAVDFSGMEDVVRKLNGTPLKVLGYVREPESGRNFAVPDDDFLANELHDFFSLPPIIRHKKGELAREGFEKHYSWDETAKKWERAILSTGIKKWDLPINIHNPPQFNTMPHLNNSDYTRYLISNVLMDDRFLDSYLELRVTRDLNHSAIIDGGDSTLYNDFSYMFSKPKFKEFNREHAFNKMRDMRGNINFWENKRK